MYMTSESISSNVNYVNSEGKTLKTILVEELTENIRNSLLIIIENENFNITTEYIVNTKKKNDNYRIFR